MLGVAHTPATSAGKKKSVTVIPLGVKTRVARAGVVLAQLDAPRG